MSHNAMRVEIIYPPRPLTTIGGGFAYFAHYRLLRAAIYDALTVSNAKYIGRYNDALTRAEMVESISRLLDELGVGHEYMPTVKVTSL